MDIALDQISLPSLSEEQSQILDKLKDGNLVVDSVAGSGKTTTNLHIAIRFNSLRILLLTYNAKLKLETRAKVRSLGIDNLEVHSYHSFVVKYYDKEAHTDTKLRTVISAAPKPLRSFSYDLIVLDEAQDITPLYYELLCKLYCDNGVEGARLCIVGDRNQSIYEFQHADERMIIFAPKVFNLNHAIWNLCSLSQSFRVTNEVANFINSCLLKENRIVSKKVSGFSPRYIICDCFGEKTGTSDRPYQEVQYYLKLGYSYEDFFIVAPSIRSQSSPVRQLANRLSDVGIPVFVPFSDEEKLDGDVVEGKIVFSTFHQVKGLERKVVLVFNFDNSYFQFYKKDKDPMICPNEIYVAVTRSLERLSVFHHYQNDYLPFMKREFLSLYCQQINHTSLKIMSNRRSKNVDTPVVDLIRHLPSQVLTESKDYYITANLKEAQTAIDIPTKVKQRFGYENVSDITGTAIPAYLEYKLKGKMSIYKPDVIKYGETAVKESKEQEVVCLLDFPNKAKEDKAKESKAKEGAMGFPQKEAMGFPHNQLKKWEESLNSKFALNQIGSHQLLEIANHWNAYTSGYIYKVNQIDGYNWLSDKQLQDCLERMKTLNISAKAKFEHRVEQENRKELSNRKMTGYIDCIDQYNVYEFKCVRQLEPEHYLQLALYAYLHQSSLQASVRESSPYRYFLYNVLTNQLEEILFSYDRLCQLAQFLIRYKYFAVGKATDLQFIQKLNSIKGKYL